MSRICLVPLAWDAERIAQRKCWNDHSHLGRRKALAMVEAGKARWVDDHTIQLTREEGGGGAKVSKSRSKSYPLPLLRDLSARVGSYAASEYRKGENWAQAYVPTVLRGRPARVARGCP
jgi:hypothetical protein